MIGLTILSLAAAALVVPATAQQEYRVARPSKIYASLDDEVAYEKPTTPVPILKQINNHNDDGSYTYGFEAADGSFKIETKEANGQVRGKYGYTDANGKLHVVEYGANKFGFQPSGEGITVPPVNYEAPEEEELQEPEQRITQIKQSKRPQPVPQQVYRQPAPAVRAPVTEPHIIYSAPVPKRPSFFAGAQLAEPEQEASYDYNEPAPQPKPAPRPSPRPSPRPQPVQYAQPSPVQYAQPSPVQYAQPSPVQYSQPKPRPTQYAPTEAPIDAFIPSAEFSQNIQFNQPQYRPATTAAKYQSIESPQTFFRQDPVPQSRPKPQPQPVRYTQTEAIISEEPREYIPRKPKAKVGGFFDQLEEQFSLPKGNAQPLHDVSFGFY